MFFSILGGDGSMMDISC